MDDLQFDRLTRRLVLGGLARGLLTALPGVDQAEAKKRSKARRCRKKKRKFCGRRCCPKGQRCENKTCIAACDDPFVCGSAGAACGANDACFCSTSSAGGSACVANEPGACTDLQACSADAPCPAGQICGSCFCNVDVLDFRCFRPCGAG